MTVALGIPTLAGKRASQGPRPDGATELRDSWGRVATDLRISLTDRCNLRCTYCMPAEGLPSAPSDHLMQADEIARLATVAVRDLGVRQVRFTGGEPLLRKDLVDIIARVAALEPRPEISLTTNAIGLASRAQALADAGLDRINVSLDTVHAATFLAVTRRPFLARVLDGIDAASTAGLTPIKINAVLLRGINDDQAAELLDWCLARGHQLRFIEQMPLDADHSWDRDTMVTAAQIRASLDELFALVPTTEPRDGAPAEVFDVYSGGEFRGQVGIIASVTESFCSDCRRTRLTSEGAVRSCLFSHDEVDLLGPLRAGASDETLAGLWRDAMWAKPSGHGLDAGSFATDSFVQPERTMSAIGG
jgi:cyclic pyranopterin phosphate synthase